VGLGVVGTVVTVEIDLSGTAYGDAPTFTDVTGWVLTKDVGSPVQISWGRQDWLSVAMVASCSFVLDNRDGRFTPGLATSPYSPNVKRRVRCRVRCDVTIPAGGLTFTPVGGTATYTMTGPAGYTTVDSDGNYLMNVGGFVDNAPTSQTLTYTGSPVTRTVYLFDGLIDSWETTRTSGGMFGLCSVSATDMLGRYGSDLPLRPMLYEEILYDLGPGNTGSMYAFNDPGPTFGDIRNVYPPLTASPGGGGPEIVYQNVTGCADTAVTGVGLGGFFSSIGGIGFAQSAGMATEMFFTTAFTGAIAVLFGDRDDDLTIGINAAGYITDGTTTGPFVADGQIHQLVYMCGDGWYLDGSRYGDVAIDTVDYLAFNLVGTVWCFTIYDIAPSRARFADHLLCARTGFAGETTAAHMARLLKYRINFGAELELGRGQVGRHATDGLALQQGLYDTADAEGSVVFADGQGQTAFRSRSHLFDPPVTLILDAADGHIESSVVYRDDIQFLVNRVTVTPPSGAVQQWQDDTSIAADGLAQQDLTLIVDSDAHAMGRAKWEVETGVQEQTSATQLECNLFTMTDANKVLGVLQLRPLDVVTVANVTGPAPTVEDFMAQGGGLSIGVEEFLASLFTTVIPAGDPY
jgi:hypothetical protein